jgi:hypothetical protein
LKPFDLNKDLKPVKKWSLILGLLVLFLSGVLVGALGTAVYHRQTAGYVLGEGQPGVRKMVMRKLVRDLDLTETQRVQIEAIVTEVQAELGKFRSQHRPEIEAIINRGLVQMRPLLSAAQQEQLDTLSQRLKEHWNSPRGPGSHQRRPWWRDRE